MFIMVSESLNLINLFPNKLISNVSFLTGYLSFSILIHKYLPEINSKFLFIPVSSLYNHFTKFTSSNYLHNMR